MHVVCLLRCLLRKDEFTGFNKGGELWKKRQQCLQDTEFGVEVAHELVNQGPIGDRGIAVIKRVGKLMESVTEVISRHLALNNIVDLTLQMNDSVGFGACKEVRKMHPNIAGGGIL
jgi:hypothetical protein